MFAAGETAFLGLTDGELAGRAALRLGAALAFGALLGWNRQLMHKAARLRTHMLVCLGAALFTLAALEFGARLEQVIQGVATGVGFIGAGAIIREQGQESVHGLTTAANVWVTAAVGVTVGLGYLWLAAIAAVLGWAVLFVIGWVEKRQSTT
jgi:putative Mg2+ transporter-C (MgtC) family protein